MDEDGGGSTLNHATDIVSDHHGNQQRKSRRLIIWGDREWIRSPESTPAAPERNAAPYSYRPTGKSPGYIENYGTPTADNKSTHTKRASKYWDIRSGGKKGRRRSTQYQEKMAVAVNEEGQP